MQTARAPRRQLSTQLSPAPGSRGPTQRLGPTRLQPGSSSASPSLTHRHASPRACWLCWWALEPVQRLLPLRALQGLYKAIHLLAPLLWAGHISAACQACIALPVTIYFIPSSLHHPVSPPLPPAWSTLCKEQALQPHLVCPREELWYPIHFAEKTSHDSYCYAKGSGRVMTSNTWVDHLHVTLCESREAGCSNSPPGGKIKDISGRVELWHTCPNKQQAVTEAGSSHGQI